MQQSVMVKHHSLGFNFKAVATIPGLTFNFDPKMPVNKRYQLEQTIYIWCTLPLSFKFPRPPSNVLYIHVIQKNYCNVSFKQSNPN